ncbi:NAD(P)(+) transhydrogenase (Re/Si-specific) subunit beta [Desulfotignum phosphitoxidans]|jgi:NAD(P) transhydrogenase subunit beta|uniref:proton-translocating NAD(P)(+) transhydrogenase n=2 Tax=Desulfotignum TaxID=115780 RepID=S0G416_9BACT|nr:NAD(P)(+) transhydrogenase (Re/Si-specific) subunit beta [Desulfotignum phosphitoxidans]EMS79042.1 NAD(P) transhydrogenase subunit beta [Desulfotignum phosphitoxidans DSM 13687]
MTLVLDFCLIGVLIVGIWLFHRPAEAKYGNLTAAAALACAMGLVIYRYGIMHPFVVVICLLVGGVIGIWVARKITMIQIPAMVAFQNGAGGIAAFFLSFVELMRGAGQMGAINEMSGLVNLAVGSLTFSGSMVAAGKLAGVLKQTPTILTNHTRLVQANLGIVILLMLIAFFLPGTAAVVFYLIIFALSIGFGILFSMRVGGADMPVLISFLNATTGLAAALCGMIIENQLLIACGATVAASGSILTHMMCRAMNRSLYHVFIPEKAPEKPVSTMDELPENNLFSTGGQMTEPEQTIHEEMSEPEKETPDADPLKTAVHQVQTADTVVIVPGYGMAVAQAQFEVIELTRLLMDMGKQVIFAIHPVAGRMPGHMNVLLAEAGVDYDMLKEMDEVNPTFAGTDLCLVIGACDVVNPAAMETDGSPISGMPILNAHEAKQVICCNLDDKPGYSGVENALYQNSNTLMLLGNAKQTLGQLLEALTETPAAVQEKLTAQDETAGKEASAAPPMEKAVNRLMSGEKIIIIPGYGMAQAQAQFQVKELADLLESAGKQVSFAIHPVAGRMPGHMNVLLAEAEVDYDKLIDMDEINPEFSQTDVALVFGACDVVNPSAIHVEGTPISGMPILNAHEAKTIVVCNYDTQPGYSGVGNTLYDDPKTILLMGDAADTARELTAAIQKKR